MSADLPISSGEQKPNGCPDHGATSTRDCAGPLNNSVCLEFCTKGLQKRRLTEGGRCQVLLFEQEFLAGTTDFNIAQNLIEIFVAAGAHEEAVGLARKCGQSMTVSGASMRQSLRIPGLHKEERLRIKRRIREIEPLYGEYDLQPC